MAAPPPTPHPLSTKIEQAVTSLLKWRHSKSKTQKPQLLSSDEFFYLILTLKDIPSQGRTNPYKIPLPTPLRTPSDTDICLIIDDREDRNKPILKKEAKSKIVAEEIGVSKVLKFTKLKSDYRPFEAKRKLCDSHDFFIADKRVVPLLPKLLGKHFFKKKKMPVPIDLTHKNWKEQIERVCGSALFYVKTGTCCVIKVGKCSMEKEEVVENVVAAIDGIVEIADKGWKSVRSLHLKLNESLALPIYLAMPDMKLKIEGAKEEDESKVEKVVEEGKKEGKKKKVSKKGRIHEVRYMDSSVNELMDGNELGIDKSEDEEKVKEEVAESKKRKQVDPAKKLVVSETISKKRSKEDDGKVEKKKKSDSGKLKSGEMKTKKLKKSQAV